VKSEAISKPKKGAGVDRNSAGCSGIVTEVDFDRSIKSLVEEIFRGRMTCSLPVTSGRALQQWGCASFRLDNYVGLTEECMLICGLWPLPTG